MKRVNVFKISLIVFVVLTLFLGSCEESIEARSNEAGKLRTEQVDSSENVSLTQDSPFNSITPLRVGKKVTQLSPYIMATYTFEKSAAANDVRISLYTAYYEEMDHDNDDYIAAIMFISRGDLQEMPLAFHIIGDLERGFIGRLNFCVFEPENENKSIIYANNSCVIGKAPNIGFITVEFDRSNNIVMINGNEIHQLNETWK